MKKKRKKIFYALFAVYSLIIIIATGYQYFNTDGQVKGISITRTNEEDPGKLQMGTFKPTIYPSKTPTPTPNRSGLTPSPAPQVNIGELINNVSEDKIREYLNHLTSNDNGTRWSGYGEERSNPNGNWIQTKYVKESFDSLGLQSNFQDFTTSRAGYKTRNVIGKILGQNNNEFYLVTAHIDSISPPHNPAPGADDNGSGSSVLMEVARILKNANLSYKISLEFILFSGEEQGLEGSYYYVGNKSSSERIKGVINIDMVGNRGSSGDCVNFGYKNYNGGDLLSSKILETNNRFNIGLITSSISSSNGRSDHKPFWDAGIPAIFGHECDFSPVYHSVSDKTDKINYTQLTKTAKVIAGALASLANE